jgi:serine/threonine-protein kinase
MDFQIGSTIGDYQILGVLGAGGMGSVYQVRNLISDRVEAMKVLLPDLTADPSLAERFQREIKLLASLDHPNIAQFRNALRSGNQILMVMEYVDGETLDHKLHDGPLPVPLALDATGQVLSALEYAHAKGIIHRDIKPANIFLTKAGVVKLMDFGIAKAASDHKLTSTGTAVGSLYYMSPEQIQGAPTLDARSDLYSVGVTLYQLVTGKRPFDGTSQFAIMSAHLEKMPVAPVLLDHNLPQALNDLILMSVAKDPNARFQTAGAFRSALAAVAATLAPTEAVAAPPPAPGLRPPPPPSGSFGTANPPAAPPPMPPPMAPPTAAAAPARAPFATANPQVPPYMPPPMPPPTAAPAPFHPQGVAAQPKSHRGLWMAVGGIAVAAAIVCLIEFGPWKGAKAESARQQTAAVMPVPVQPPVTAPAPQADATPAPPQDAAPQPAPAPKRDATAKPAPRTQEANAVQPQPAQPQPPPPQPQAQQPPPQPAAQPVPEPAPAAPKQPNRQEVMKAREFMAKLHFRADAINNLLQGLQRRQEASGMSLNARFTRPQGLMNTYLQSADEALNEGDLPAYKDYREKAERQIETLEKLLNM